MSEQIAYSKASAAKAMDVSLSTIDRAIKNNELVAHRVGAKGGLVRIAADDLMRWFKSSPTESSG